MVELIHHRLLLLDNLMLQQVKLQLNLEMNLMEIQCNNLMLFPQILYNHQLHHHHHHLHFLKLYFHHRS